MQHPFSAPADDFRGQSLDRLCQEPMEIAAFLRHAARIAGALAEVHQSGVVHRNIKPQNILIDSDTGEVRIADLHLAVRLPSQPPSTKGRRVIGGTLAYMSPEQTGRINRWIDERTDLYSLGVTFYEMLAGKLPFQVSDPLEWVHCHVARLPPPLVEIRPEIPGTVSDIVMKLLAKAAEDRYQTAHGLKLDLETCLLRWLSTGNIEPFPLGDRDASERFQIPQKLHGREREIEILTGAFDRVVSHGKSELVLVSGYSGIGKSSLVNELHKPIVRSRGSFVAGKFDQYKRNIPYATILQVLRQLVLERLSASEEELGAIRLQLSAELGPNGQVMVDLVPEVEILIGQQAPAPEIPMSEAQNRQNLVVRQFLGVFARRERPVVIFLDDLQWADMASLDLFAHIASHPEVKHILILGAYRDNEVNPSHPLMLALDEARKAGATMSSIVLGPLSGEHLGRLVAGALHQRPEQVAPLARLVHEKTAGNPFFAIQFLKRLHQEQLVYFDARASTWRWDLEKINEKGFTDNVVDLLVERLKQLPPAAQGTIELAACLGDQVDLRTLATISGRTEDEARESLGALVKEGLLLSDGDSYQFLHDRVQQAGYSLMASDRRSATHLHIGRLLLQHTAPESVGERVFEIVNQLNLGAAGITDADEKRRLAELNLQAGKKAKASSAWQPAARLLSLGIEQLGPMSWETDHDLTYTLHFELAECEYMSAQHEEAERLTRLLLDRCKSKTGKAQVCCMKIEIQYLKGQVLTSVETALEGLRLFGIDLPLHPSKEQVQEEYDELQRNLAARPIEALVDLPLMTDPDMMAAMRILSVLWAPALSIDENLTTLHLARMVNICLRYGNTDAGTIGYAWWGITLIHRFHRYREGYRFGKLSHDVMVKHGFVTFEAKVYYSLELISAWSEPLPKAIELAKTGFLAGSERGDLLVASYCCNHLVTLLLAQGAPLSEVHEEAARRIAFARAAGVQAVVDIIRNMQRYIQNMRGLTQSFSTFSGDQYDQDAFEAGLALESTKAVPFWYWILKMQARFMTGDHEQALAAARSARDLLWAAPPCHFQFHDFHFYDALLLAAVYGEASPDERRQYEGWLSEHQAQLKEWAESCPETFLASHALVSAEIARIEGRALEAIELYDQAIRAARANGFTQNEALGNELAARFYLGRGIATTAKGHLEEARACYSRWGAEGKVRQLERIYPDLLARPTPVAPTAAATVFNSTPEQLDIFSITKASQSISSEIILPRLAETLIRIVVEAAGAERGYLLRPDPGDGTRDWVIQVEASVDRTNRDIEARYRGEPLSPAALPEAILNYVKRTREQVLLDDAATDTRFSEDAYIARQRPRSVLCMPIVRQAKLVGALYLENNITAGAFTPERLTVLQLLVSQAAISLENAALYANLSQENADRKRAESEVRALNDALELRVQERTAQLSEANKELKDQFELIRRQQEAIRVLSAPIIEVWEGVLTVPVIGPLDRERAQMMLEALLASVQRSRSRWVIIDVTGVASIEADTADQILRMIRSIRLLGAQGIVVGIKPQVANTLASLGVDLSSILTLANLRQALLGCMNKSL